MFLILSKQLLMQVKGCRQWFNGNTSLMHNLLALYEILICLSTLSLKIIP